MVSQSHFGISLIAMDVEQFFNCLLAISNSSVRNPLFRSAPKFTIELFGNLISSFLISRPLPNVGLMKICLHSIGCCFVINHVHCVTEGSQFQDVPFINCFSQCLCY